VKEIRVFVSYTHDSEKHIQNVIELTQMLRHDGIDANVDAFLSGSPIEGWPLWMERQMAEARFVLLICSPNYLRRFEGKEEQGIGLGGVWESHLTRNDLYSQQGLNFKYIPILFAGATISDVPGILRHQYTTYNHPNDYQKLLRVLTGQVENVPVPLGQKNDFVEFTSSNDDLGVYFADSIKNYMGSLNKNVEMLTRDQYRIIVQLRGNRRVRISGLAGSGKTLVGAEKSIRLSEAGISTLFLCHNPLLASDLTEMTKGSGVRVESFGRWVESLCGGSSIIDGNQLWSNLVEPTDKMLEIALDAVVDRGPRYEAIIVDEGQDFRDEWWFLVEAALLGSQSSILYIFHDDCQALLPYRSKYPIENPVIDLSRNCRNAGKIYEVMRAIHPNSPPPEAKLDNLGKVSLFDCKGGQDILTLSKAVNWLYQTGAKNQFVALLGGETTYANSILYNKKIYFGGTNWQDLVRNEFELAQNVYNRTGVSLTGTNTSKLLKELSDLPYPTGNDTELVQRVARKFTIDPLVRRKIFTAPQWRNALSWENRDGEFALSRAHWTPRWSAETYLHFQREDWHIGLPKPKKVNFKWYSEALKKNDISVYTVGDFKGLEADFVLFVYIGRGLIPINEIYVGISRARMLLSIVADMTYANILPEIHFPTIKRFD
jgi:SEFIR domain